jgi:hypothetical protein
MVTFLIIVICHEEGIVVFRTYLIIRVSAYKMEYAAGYKPAQQEISLLCPIAPHYP